MEIIYVADPMCSWCYAFAPTMERLEGVLAPGVGIRYVMGGLAEDSDEPMPQAVARMIQGAWDAIERVTDVSFNREFWTKCQPRRSTYPACRAVLAAEALEPGSGPRVFRGIQRAYYQEARNPSDEEVLLDVAEAAGFARGGFMEQLRSSTVEDSLQRHLAERSKLGVEVGAAGFPTLALRSDDGSVRALTSGYCPWTELEPKLRGFSLVVDR